ncbi:DUF397 domain-containing protein [Streptomyces europaeiscabiei]|nr:DUF397 domain-containing protein [Streptomyces europaeiscabiei]MDX2774939.1 DUF397 domain-containing protein [Streptomyces europaeiscabiei]MDX3668254.1 DUF397 domain-containing protein [Streptomyces europaeiscabiei]MDX3708891.1 DUF397 domain-containing protein [Streptomyces europaeiscabiei]MDX3830937.1 DUF397 domain-containing protein [Streptomyces europaeiscabiei]MDX3864464.1 DUF397 domain-containing protein [Streptomyces europaeiscabiei]
MSFARPHRAKTRDAVPAAGVHAGHGGAVTTTGGHALRDDKNPHGPLVYLSPHGWYAFPAAAKDAKGIARLE